MFPVRLVAPIALAPVLAIVALLLLPVALALEEKLVLVDLIDGVVAVMLQLLLSRGPVRRLVVFSQK